jgi:hypothetical protein
MMKDGALTHLHVFAALFSLHRGRFAFASLGLGRAEARPYNTLPAAVDER